MSREIELLTEIRDLMQVIAEPALAKRDAKLRSSLRGIVGNSEKRAGAIFLMDGTRSQAAIVKESGMDQGNVSRLVKALGTAQLISADEKRPKLMITISRTFFDQEDPGE